MINSCLEKPFNNSSYILLIALNASLAPAASEFGVCLNVAIVTQGSKVASIKHKLPFLALGNTLLNGLYVVNLGGTLHTSLSQTPLAQRILSKHVAPKHSPLLRVDESAINNIMSHNLEYNELIIFYY